ncbi:hypothetical protein [Kitasatospora sp. DSM 101779]|nr:hypothetical protein [Kitasatospora sp. DSM 101779]
MADAGKGQRVPGLRGTVAGLRFAMEARVGRLWRVAPRAWE